MPSLILGPPISIPTPPALPLYIGKHPFSIPRRLIPCKCTQSLVPSAHWLTSFFFHIREIHREQPPSTSTRYPSKCLFLIVAVRMHAISHTLYLYASAEHFRIPTRVTHCRQCPPMFLGLSCTSVSIFLVRPLSLSSARHLPRKFPNAYVPNSALDGSSTPGKSLPMFHLRVNADCTVCDPESLLL